MPYVFGGANGTECFHRFDCHVHVGCWREPGLLGHGSTLADVVRDLEAAHITGALVMPTDEGDNENLLRELQRYSGALGLLFAAWVDPRTPDNWEFVQTHGEWISALKIHPTFLTIPITADSFGRYLEHAQKMGWPVLVHCGRHASIASFELALGVARSFPSVRFVLSHMGGDAPSIVARVVETLTRRGLDNVYLGTESIREPFVWRHALSHLGAGRLVFGSDLNLNHPQSFLAIVDALDLSERERRMLLGENARELLL